MTQANLEKAPENLKWSPSNSNGATNFLSHYIKTDKYKAKVVKSTKYKAFISFFYGIGLWAILLGIPFNIRNSNLASVIFMLLLGSMFLGGAYFLFGTNKL